MLRRLFSAHNPQMSCCSICYERFSSPVSVPCGHVFCRDCLLHTIDAIKSPNIQHFCPACRAPYSVVSIDPALVHPYLRPHIQHPLRPVFLDYAPSDGAFKAGERSSQSQQTQSDSRTPETASPDSVAASHGSSTFSLSPGSPLDLPHIPSQLPTRTQSLPEIAVVGSDSGSGSPLLALATLRRSAASVPGPSAHLQTWRHRAEVHAAANAGLLSYARTTRAAAVRLRAERDDARRRVEVLQRQLNEALAMPNTKRVFPELAALVNGANSRRSTPASGIVQRQLQCPAAPAKRTLPNFLVQHRTEMRPVVASWDAQPSLLGPPLKRRKLSPSPSPRSSSTSVPVQVEVA
ncbi:RING-type domain-containing protein [Mycena kentingensis (nom. inval.)]|nr:RING-type domain-containing protein [Mycena kentingensis (nom. inval.)]